MVSLRIEDLRKEFGELIAVENFNLTINEGEFVTLVGPSGCGKTTTLRCVAGLEDPTSGNVWFGDTDVSNYPPQQRGTALLFQDIALYPHMTVEDNMAYPLKLSGMEKEKRQKRIQNSAERLQIADQLQKMPSELSGGQQQRVALGRSMVREPTLFLFDEPMSDLDAKLKRELRPLFAEVTQEVGCPTMYVTHDQEEAMTLSDRIAIMNNGRREQVGTPDQVYGDPSSEFVGEFIGQPTMEFFDAVVKKTNGEVFLNISGEETLKLPVDQSLESYSNSDVRLGIRPQNINALPKTDQENDGISAEHIFDEPLGDQTHSLFDTQLGNITVVMPSDFRGENHMYSLQLDESAVKVFDPDSGVRIK